MLRLHSLPVSLHQLLLDEVSNSVALGGAVAHQQVNGPQPPVGTPPPSYCSTSSIGSCSSMAPVCLTSPGTYACNAVDAAGLCSVEVLAAGTVCALLQHDAL